MTHAEAGVHFWQPRGCEDDPASCLIHVVQQICLTCLETLAVTVGIIPQ